MIPPQQLEWLCVGGGPCGTFAVGVLLKRGLRVGWVESGSFETMGRLGACYGSVPANTRNDRLVSAFSSMCSDFEESQAAREERGEKTLSNQPLDGTCELRYSVDALLDASRDFRNRSDVAIDQVQVQSLAYDGSWMATLSNGDRLRSSNVILTTGSAPRAPSPALSRRLEQAGIRVVPHDDVVVPDRCRDLHRDGEVAIVGGAHSGMLAAMNLVARGNRDVVRVYDRKKEPRFAEERDGWIKYDGTGLKGSVADFARENTSAEADGEKKIAYRQILSSGTEEEQSEALVSQLVADGVKSVAFAWGFEKKPTLQVYDADGESVDVFGSEHDGRTGKILGGAPPGLYGGGIAFPEYWTDEDGYTEPRVGFVGHYLKHLDRIIDDASNPHR